MIPSGLRADVQPDAKAGGSKPAQYGMSKEAASTAAVADKRRPVSTDFRSKTAAWPSAIKCLPQRSAAMALSTFLYRRAGYGAVGAEHAAIAWLWFQQDMAALAFVKPLAGVGGHGFSVGMAAVRAGQRG